MRPAMRDRKLKSTSGDDAIRRSPQRPASGDRPSYPLSQSLGRKHGASMTTTTTSDFGAALNSAIQGGYIAQLNGGTYTISSPIVIHITSTTQGMGIDGGGATLISNVTNGQPLIQIVVDPGVDARYLNLSNFKIQGNGKEGDGIQLIADGNDRWLYNWNITNVTVDHVSGYGLDMQGSIFEGVVSNSWMTNNAEGG